MDVRIVGDAMRQHFAAIKTLVVKAIKTHAAGAARQAHEQGREARKQFEVDDGVDPLAPCPDQECQGVPGQVK
jgi:hypothetical protein